MVIRETLTLYSQCLISLGCCRNRAELPVWCPLLVGLQFLHWHFNSCQALLLAQHARYSANFRSCNRNAALRHFHNDKRHQFPGKLCRQKFCSMPIALQRFLGSLKFSAKRECNGHFSRTFCRGRSIFKNDKIGWITALAQYLGNGLGRARPFLKRGSAMFSRSDIIKLGDPSPIIAMNGMRAKNLQTWASRGII